MAGVLSLLAGEAADLLGRTELLSRLEGLARFDPLTGLANRRVWDERLSLALADAARTGRPLALALLDLDHFRPTTTASVIRSATACCGALPRRGSATCARATRWRATAARSSAW